MILGAQYRYLVDTNIISELGKDIIDDNVAEKLTRHQGCYALAAPTWFELWQGYHRIVASKRKECVLRFLEELPDMPILPFDADAAEWLALEWARLSSMGQTPSHVDAQIAAIAVRH